MKHIIRYTAALLLAATALPASAQEFRSSYFLTTSNFRHQMNPALLDSAYVSIPFLGNINVGATGNVGLKDFVYKLEGNPQYDLTTFMSPTVSADQFLGNLHDKNRMDVYLNYNIFSVGFKAFHGMNLVELNVRSNTNASLPYSLFEFMKTAGAKENYSLHDIGVRSQNYLELALGHSHQINDKLRIGGKLKFLLGLAYADFSVDKLDVTMNGDQWQIDGDARLKASVMKSNLEYEDASKNAPDGRRRVKDLDDTSFGIPGFGLAVDLGVNYKLNDDWTFSAGLTDLGFISWSKTKHASSAGSYTFSGFDNIYAGSNNTGNNKLGDQFEDLGDDLEEMFSVYDDGEKTATQALAATLNVGAEYTLPSYRNLRFGFLYTSRIHGLYSYHQGMLAVNIRPVKAIELGINGAVGSTGCTFGGVVSLKAPHFNFYIGADRFFGKLSKQGIPLNNLNANVTMGMTIPL
jgi:hypothetical protein